jgi:hypothetical protein
VTWLEIFASDGASHFVIAPGTGGAEDVDAAVAGAGADAKKALLEDDILFLDVLV